MIDLIFYRDIPMTPKLTDDLQQALAENGGIPLYVVDPATNLRYVLLREEEYEKARLVLEREDGQSPRDAYPFVDQVMADDDAHDPLLAYYQTFSRPRS